MRRLAIAIASASAAFAAGAAALSADTGTTFGEYTVDDAFSAADAAPENGKYWWYSADETSGTIADFTGDAYGGDRANSWNDATALSLDAANPLYRAAEGADEAIDGVASLTPVDTADGLYIDTLVQLGEYDSEPEPAAGDKLFVWAGDSDGSTVLYVTAGKYGENGAVSPFSYVVTTLGESAFPAEFDFEAWHRVTIKAFDAEFDGVEGAKPAFSIYVDGELAGASGDTTVFPSLVQNASTISAVAFVGTGAVDDILFTATAPAFAQAPVSYVASIGETNYETLAAAVAAAQSGDTIVLLANNAESIVLPAGVTLSVGSGISYTGTVSAAEGYILASSTDDETGAVTYTQSAVVAVIYGPNAGEFASLQDAVAAAGEGDIIYLMPNAAVEGAVVIPAGVTVNVTASGVSFAGVTSLSGAGVLAIDGGSATGTVDNNHAEELLDGEGWTGTLALINVSYNSLTLDYYGNANSTVRLSNVTVGSFALGGRSNDVGTLELVGRGLTISALSFANNFPCDLKGDGSLTVHAGSTTQNTVSFTGDVSRFSGSVTVDSGDVEGGQARVAFGSQNIAGNGNVIAVGSDVEMTVAASKTWSVNDLVLGGTLTVDGTVTLASGAHLWKSADSARYVCNNSASAVTPAASWTGTYVIGWSPSGAFDPNAYGNASSTVAMAADLASGAYFGASSGALTNAPALKLEADVAIKNGYSRTEENKASQLVTFSKLTGDHSLAANFAGKNASEKVFYKIENIEDFTGTLSFAANNEVEIAKVSLAAAPVAGACIVPVTLGTGSIVNGDFALWVGGVDTGKTLEYVADAETPGLYVPLADEYIVSIDGTETSYATFTEALFAAGRAPASAQSVVLTVVRGDDDDAMATGAGFVKGVDGEGRTTYTRSEVYDDGSGNHFTIADGIPGLPEGKSGGDVATGSTLTYAQAYVLGLLDEATGEVGELPALSIEIVDGLVYVTLAAGDALTDAYTITTALEAKTSLAPEVEWAPVEEADDPTKHVAGEIGTALVTEADADAKFFRVKLSISNK